jgi:hypothetical protein
MNVRNSEAAALGLARAIDAGRPIIRLRWTDREDQWRTITDVGGALWATPVEGETQRFSDLDRKHRAARLQRECFPNGITLDGLELPPSNIRIVSSEAHPAALYIVARQLATAIENMGRPDALTFQDIAERLPALPAILWLRDYNDSDFLDFAMDAAGYKWTSSRLGRARSTMIETKYVFVRRHLSFAEQAAAIKARRARRD